MEIVMRIGARCWILETRALDRLRAKEWCNVIAIR